MTLATSIFMMKLKFENPNCFVDANVQKLKPLAFYFSQELTKLQGILGLKIVFLLYLIVKMDKY